MAGQASFIGDLRGEGSRLCHVAQRTLLCKHGVGVGEGIGVTKIGRIGTEVGAGK